MTFKETEEDQILQELQYIQGRINASSQILTDKQKTAFFMVRSTIPLYETEVRGTNSLARMGEVLFA